MENLQASRNLPTSLAIVFFLAMSTLLGGLAGHAQGSQACDRLLEGGLRDVIRSFHTEDIEKAAFKRHCSKQNEEYSFSDKADFMWFFRATASPDFDMRKGERWCKENASRLEQSSTRVLEVMTYSREALRAFNDCMRLQRDNVLVDAVVENDALILSVWRNSGRPSWLQRFSYDSGALACEVSGPHQAQAPDLTKPIQLVDDLRVNIVCRRRTLDSAEPGVWKVRPKTTVVLTTDLSTPLALTLEEEKTLEAETLRALEARIAAITEPHVLVPWLPFDWNGNPRAIPAGWVLCDGSELAGTRLPDLRGRFLMGEGKGEPAGSKGGASGWNWRSGRYNGNPTRDYLHKASGSPDMRPPWDAVQFLCRTS